MKFPIRVIVNPVAGHGRGARAGRRVSEILRRVGRDHEERRTTEPGHAGELAAEFARAEPDGLVLVVGGDGTAHEAVQGLGREKGRGVFAFAPAGGGNDAARTIGSPRDLDAAVRSALDGAERALDLGVVGEEFFLNGVGVGLDGDAASRSHDLAPLRGLPAYLIAALAAVAAFEPTRLRLETAGELLFDGPAMLCAVGNGPSCGGGFRLTPDADPGDGALDACAIAEMGRLETLRKLPGAVTGRHRSDPKASFFRGGEFRLDSDRPLWAHADGEVWRPDFPMNFRVARGALRVRGGNAAV